MRSSSCDPQIEESTGLIHTVDVNDAIALGSGGGDIRVLARRALRENPLDHAYSRLVPFIGDGVLHLHEAIEAILDNSGRHVSGHVRSRCARPG